MIYDISYPLEETIQVYKNAEIKKPVFKTIANHQDDHYHETNITINVHTGTHVDYPLHMIANGDTSDTEDLTPLIGPCKVIDFTSLDKVITLEDIKGISVEENDFLLFKTKNSFSDEFLDDFVYLSEDAAMYLKERKIRGVGTDGLGIERAQEGHPTHKVLLANGIIILEGLRLKDVPEGAYNLTCLPLSIKGVEASLARAILTT